MKQTLTNKEKIFISQISCDLMSGNHLLRPRSADYMEFFRKFQEMLRHDVHTEKETEMIEYYRQCSDFEYWKKLSPDDRMF